MQEFNLSIPATSLVVTSRDVNVTVDVAAIPHDVLRQVMWHGIKQKVADAASAAASLVYFDVKGKNAPKPSRDQLSAFAEVHDKAIKEQTLALMQKAVDALLAGKWAVREASGGTTSRWTEEQQLALELARGVLQEVFVKALAKAMPGTKPTATAFVALSPKVAAFFKQNEKRPTWDDAAVMAWIGKQAEAGTRDYMAEARAELARREAANAGLANADLDDMLGDI